MGPGGSQEIIMEPMLQSSYLCCTFLAMVAGIVVGCTRIPEQPPNIVWIVAEDIGPAWGAYGDAFATTPNIDRLASEGLVFRNAFANAPICAPARSTLVTGIYATSLGTEHLRSEIPRTPGVGTVPEYLKEAGYWVTSTRKTDYNFSPEGIWDDWPSDDAPWRTRPEGAPFFSMLNYAMTHEGPSNMQDRYEAAIAGLPEEMLHDPAGVKVPPYYPDTPEIRRLWAQIYDLITVFDAKVGDIIGRLAEDGLLDDTIVMVFSDHGFGMPRYKRWLTDSGMRIPFVMRVPERYRHLAAPAPGSDVKDLVSIVDFGPTTLSLAGVPIPEHMQGQAFLGPQAAAPREYVLGYRGRADDMYEISRAIHGGRYIYVRHYMPHYPYIQRGRIFGDQKSSLKELRRLHRAGELPPEAERMWHPKPPEELYDLEADPGELHNLAGSPEHRQIQERMHAQLREVLVATRDAGLLIEPEMMIRSEGSSPYAMAREEGRYDVARVLEAAELAGTDNLAVIRGYLLDEDSAVRFWAAEALIGLGEKAAEAKADLLAALEDPAPAVAIAAAEALCGLGECAAALPALEKRALDDRPTTALFAARTIQMIGRQGCPLTPVMRKVIERNRDPEGKSSHGYRDFNYAAFTGWALEEALINCGEKP